MWLQEMLGLTVVFGHLIINCAIGGVLGGTVGTDYWTKVGTKTYPDGGVNDVYQDKMYVDYVRVYQ